IGDIPIAEIKPPDNVLFVCKLNPVTEDEDLHTIFSRFGVVTSADIIRDYKTGDSLCYAFIEFRDKDACEQAYFKMDNALIDDRRIHVDFSQSVAKLWSQYNREGGGGCFKCGSHDHRANDCTVDSSSKQPPPKYVLRDDAHRQRGDGDKRYEMVFEEDDDDEEEVAVRANVSSRNDKRPPPQGERRARHDGGTHRRTRDEDCVRNRGDEDDGGTHRRKRDEDRVRNCGDEDDGGTHRRTRDEDRIRNHRDEDDGDYKKSRDEAGRSTHSHRGRRDDDRLKNNHRDESKRRRSGDGDERARSRRRDE
ncbi:hypothetical protein M569_06171, partial [Genlisea aurea]